MPDIGALAPEPEVVIEPGVRVTVQEPVPVVGNPFKITLPVASAHVGAVMVPTVGAIGIVSGEFIPTTVDADEVHPDALATV